MIIPTEPIGSIPRTPELLAATSQDAPADAEPVLQIIARHLKPGQMVFVGVVDVNHPHIETADQVRDRVLQAARFIPLGQLGTTDDCGFSPFCDDRSTSRDTAFAKIRARVEGTALARAILKDRA